METYWKRRVFVLAGILVVVALVAYACSGPSDEGKRAADTSGSSSGGGNGTSPAPDTSGSPSPSAEPSGDPSASPSPDGSAGPGGGDGGGGTGEGADGSGAGGGDGGRAAAPKKPGDPCRPQDVVVNLEVDRTDFAWDAEPRFTVTATNTGDQECMADIGAKGLEIRITSGADKVFSTAHCAKGTEKKRLTTGVGVSKKVEWNRKRSWSDCPDKDVDAKRPGTYVATVIGDFNDEHGEHRQVFRLN